MNEPAVVAKGLSRTYRRGAEEVHALKDLSFRIDRGEFVAVVGQSGAGKTTLLNLVGCMDTPSAGELSIAGHPVQGLSEAGLTRLRRQEIGFVFQQFALLPTLSVAENVALPALFAGRRSEKRVCELLERVGLTPRRAHRP